MPAPLSPPALLAKAQAIALAQAHLAHLNAANDPATKWRWAVSQPTEYTPYWYFDYERRWPPGYRPTILDTIGYPPGYLIWKQTHACTLVGWGELATLLERERCYQQATQLASQLLAEPLSLARLRQYIRLPLPGLAQLGYTLRTLADTQAQHAHLLTCLHEQALAEARLGPLPILPLASQPSSTE